MTTNVWHCCCIYCTKKHRWVLHFSIVVSHGVLSRTTVFETRPKDQAQDQGRSETSHVIRPWSQTTSLFSLHPYNAIRVYDSILKQETAVTWSCSRNMALRCPLCTCQFPAGIFSVLRLPSCLQELPALAFIITDCRHWIIDIFNTEYRQPQLSKFTICIGYSLQWIMRV